MMKLNHLKLATRLILSFAVLSALTALIAIVGLSSLSAQSQHFEDVVFDNSRKIALSQDLSTSVHAASASISTIILNGDDTAIVKQELTQLKLERAEYDQNWAALERLPASDAGRVIRKKIDAGKIVARAANDVVIALVLDKKLSEARVALTASAMPSNALWLAALVENQALQTAQSEEQIQLSNQEIARAKTLLLVITGAVILGGLWLGLLVTGSIQQPVNGLLKAMAEVARTGDLNQNVQYAGRDEFATLVSEFNGMLEKQRLTTQAIESQNWVNTGMTSVAEQLRSDLSLGELSRLTVSCLARYTEAQAAALFVFDEEHQYLSLMASFAYELRKGISNRFALGEGLVGQAALEKQLISVTNLPADYSRIASATGDTLPRNVLVMPLVHENQIKGVLELSRVTEFDPVALDLLRRAADAIAVGLHVAQSAENTRVLLAQTLQQAQTLKENEASLQTQQEELQQTNEVLEEQTQALRESETNLKTQQEELQQTNEVLEEQAQALKASETNLKAQQEELRQTNEVLETQKLEVNEKNIALKQAQTELQQESEDLAAASKYKSEFLSNMSHELRTPLNSMLILSRTLADNRDGNLSAKQVESARIMHQSGDDLLSIINDILDLSKIEAGYETAVLGELELSELAEQLNALYSIVAEDKGVSFNLNHDPALPAFIISDRQRIGQILRNLLSNAFKFTYQGGVTLTLAPARGLIIHPHSRLANAGEIISLSVSDTGIGIALEKQKQIWEAFQQADGSTSREFGGTGLGLTISRELAKLLGGELRVQSELGKGSTFTLYLPVDGPTEVADGADERQAEQKNPAPVAEVSRPVQRAPAAKPVARVKEIPIVHIADDRDGLTGEAPILIVEDDPGFAKILGDICHEKGFKYIACPTAEEALEWLALQTPQAVLLDMQLPKRDGWSVLSHIKENPSTLHIPVYVMSAGDHNSQVIQHGALGFVQKPVSPQQLQAAFDALDKVRDKHPKEILLIEDDKALSHSVHALLESADVTIHEANTGAEALARMAKVAIDLIVLDLGLPDMSGFEVLEQAQKLLGAQMPPVIVFTGRDLTRTEHAQLNQHSASVILKSVRSDERLVEEVALFLHRRASNLPERARKMMASIHDREALFAGKKVLLVDDDLRNIFALSGLLEERGLTVFTAKNGEEALDFLAENTGIDILLTDVMMPGMDGYELIQRVRAQEKYARLPILALTAKVMKADRERCMEVGASDYLSKPVNVDRLLSTMRVWLYR
jgi:CheY-like chemotaxis protein